MTIEVLPPERTAPATAILLHTLIFPEVLESKKPVSDRCGYLVAGPDRKGANAVPPVTLWRTWQRDVQTATLRPGAWPVPAKVQEYFQRTKHLQSPPKGDLQVEVYGSAPSILKEDLVFDDLTPETCGLDTPTTAYTDMNPGGTTPMNLDLGLNLDALIASAPQVLTKKRLLDPQPHFATSYTGMTEFQLCARKWAASKYFKTVKYVESEAMADGNRGHKTAENYLLNAQGKSLPVDPTYLPKVKRYCDHFIKSGAKILVEQEMCCTKDRKPCGWWDNKIVHIRGKGDVLMIKDRKLNYADWKFGKVKDDPFQVEVMVALADLHYGDEFDEADGKLIFVKEADPAKALVGLKKPITKADIPGIWDRISEITDKMEIACRDEVFPCSPNFLCKGYCDDFTCHHNGRRG